MKGKKRKIIIFSVLVVAIVAASIFVVRTLSNKDSRVNKFREAKTGEFAKSKVYYVQTTYKDRDFRVIDDNKNEDDSHTVTALQDKTTIIPADYDRYATTRIAPNQFVIFNVPYDEYNKKIDEMSFFKYSGKVTTVVVDINDKKKEKKYNAKAFMYQYPEGKLTGLKYSLDDMATDAVAQTNNAVREKDLSPLAARIMDVSPCDNKSLTEYIKKYGFKKYD